MTIIFYLPTKYQPFVEKIWFRKPNQGLLIYPLKPFKDYVANQSRSDIIPSMKLPCMINLSPSYTSLKQGIHSSGALYTANWSVLAFAHQDLQLSIN